MDFYGSTWPLLPDLSYLSGNGSSGYRLEQTVTSYDKLSSSWIDVRLGMPGKIFLCGEIFFPHQPDCLLN